MQRFSNKPRRPKAKAAAGRKHAAAGRADAWHEVITRGLFTALALFIGVQFVWAMIAGQTARAAVGDHVVIGAGPDRFSGATPLITATEASSGAAQTCRLDVSAMKHPGGVLTVLESGPAKVTLSWAGGATAPGNAACRREDFTISANDYTTLVNAGRHNINAR